MRIEVTQAELQEGIKVPLDERTTLVLIPNALVEVRTPEGEPVPGEPVLVKYTDGRMERLKADGDGNVKLYGKKNEVFNVTLLGRPKGQQGEAKHAEGGAPCATVFLNGPDGTAIVNEEVLVERGDGSKETYFSNGEGRIRIFGDPGEELKFCLVNQPKDAATIASGS